MVLFIVLGVVVAMAIVVVGVLFYMLSKEGQKKKEEENAVPLTDLAELKKELSNQLFEPNDLRLVTKENEIIPVFGPKVSMPVADEPPSKEDEAYKKRAQHLEDELLAISKKADGQSDEARQLIVTLTKENEALKSREADLQQAQQKLTEIQAEASGLKNENISLQSQLETTHSRVQILEEEMTAVKLQMGDEISRAKELVSRLTREKEELESAPKPEPDEALHQELEALKIEQFQLRQKYDDLEKAYRSAPKTDPDEALRQELETLRTEYDQLKQKYEELEKAQLSTPQTIPEVAQLKQKCEDLEKSSQELAASNAQLAEKIDSMQYELIKAKAQSSGLERISFNYKNQLEDFFKKINAVQVTNDHLSEVKNRLEGMVEEIKTQNEELVNKDRLSQFELEKNRSRLQSLEREYQDLKLRLQQQSQQ